MIYDETNNKATHIAKNLPIFTDYIFTFITRVFLIGTLAQLYILTHSDSNLLSLYLLLTFLCFIAFVSQPALYLYRLIDSINQKIKLITKKSYRITAAILTLIISIGLFTPFVLFAGFVFETIGEAMSMVTTTQQY